MSGERGSDFHPHKVHKGGDRIKDQTREVDQEHRNRPKGRKERISRRQEEAKKSGKIKQRPGRRQR